MRKLVAAAETIDGVGASLDLRHDPGDEEHGKEHDALADEYIRSEHAFRGVLRGFVSMRAESVADNVGADKRPGEKGEED